MRTMRSAILTIGLFGALPAAADVIFQDSFNSRATFSTKWEVRTTNNGGTATVSNGKVAIQTVGGSNGYMGIGDGIAIVPKLPSMDLTNSTIEFNLREVLRKQTNGNKDSVSFAFNIANGDNTLSVSLHGNFSGYDPDQPDCGWGCYNTYNKHTLWISEHTPTGENRVAKIALKNAVKYNYFFKVIPLSDKVVIGYRKEEQPDYTYVVANISGYNTPTQISLGAGSGDGGYTYENASGKVEVDSFMIYTNSGVRGTIENVGGWKISCKVNGTQIQYGTRPNDGNGWSFCNTATNTGDTISVTITGTAR